MSNKPFYNLRQLLAVCTVFFLSPALRLVPSGTSLLAGRAAWLSVFFALPLVFFYVLFFNRLIISLNEGESLAELFLRFLGPVTGRLLLGAVSVWFLLYAGFMLRSGSLRMITTIYPNAKPFFFILSMGVLCLYSALGKPLSLVRCAKLIQPLVLSVLLFVLFFALFGVQKDNLLPLTVFDFRPCARASLASLGVCTVSIYSAFFLPDLSFDKKHSLWLLLRWAFFSLLLLFLLNLVIIGSFGSELTAALSQPFFSLVRTLSFFHGVERVEALVVSLWIFCDFILISLCIHTAQHALILIVSKNQLKYGTDAPPVWLRPGLSILSVSAVILLAAIIAQEPQAMEFWSRQLIPGINLSFSVLLLPTLLLIGKQRNKNEPTDFTKE